MAGVNGRAAIVTGAAQGIGLAIARRLCAGSAKVVLADVSGDKVEQAAEALRQAGGNAVATRTDVCSSAEVEAMVRLAVDTFGTVEILVNNAGGSGDAALADIEDITDEVWDKVVNSNLRGTFYCTRAVAPVMKRQRHGRIINLSSILARGSGGPLGTVGARIPYSAAKSGIEGLTRQTAKDLGRFEITVNAIVPGLVMTEPGARMGDRFGQMDAAMQTMILDAFNGRPADGDDVAAMVAYLAADETSRVNGQEIGIGMI